MTTYVAPTKDMLFAMNELAGLADVAKLPGCEEVSPDLAEAILDEAGKFAAEVLAPLNATGDRAGNKLQNGVVTTAPGFKDAYKKFVDNGWHALSGSTKYGGQGMPSTLATAVHEMWKSSNLAFSLCPMLTQGAASALVYHGTDSLKSTYVSKMVSGEWSGTMNLTEPQAGSDLAAVRTRALPEGDHYRLSGTKIFITWGEQDFTDNIVHLVLARLPDAPEGVKGISLFLVPKYLVNPDGSIGARNDVQCVSLEHKMGIHASPTAVLSYGEKQGAIGYLVGEANRGLEYMFTMMNNARLAVGLEGVAISERAYQKALNYARDRVQGKPLGATSKNATIIQHPDVRRMLMSMKAQVEAMRALAYFTASYMDKLLRHTDANERKRAQAVVDFLTPIVKGWATEQANEITSVGVQVHGGMGFIEETGAAQYMRDARITTIYEGTTGIQALDLVGRKVAREGGATAKALLAEVRKVQQESAAAKGEDFKAISDGLAAGITAAEEATDYIVNTFAANAREALAGSVPYLMLMGTVLGGWQMARAALVSQQKLDANEGDSSFYQAKIGTARFYADHILPRVTMYRHEILNGAASTLRLEEAQF